MGGRELLLQLGRLPCAGRQNLRDILAEECGDVSVFRNVLLRTATAFANVSVRHCMRKTKKLEPPLWESVLLLQILWSAEAKRLALAASAALAAREEDDVSMDLARTLSAGGRASPVAGGRASPLSGIA